MQALHESHAQALAIGSFFNALLREWQAWRPLDPQAAARIDPDACCVIPLPLTHSGKTAFLCLDHYSTAGRHRFRSPLLINQTSQPQPEPVAFTTLVSLLSREEQILGKVDETQRRRFVEKVKTSVTNIAEMLVSRPESLQQLLAKPLGFEASEQALFAGHAVHPSPKSRDQFSTTEERQYLPESGRAFPLHWLAIHDDDLVAESAHSLSFKRLTRRLADEDRALPSGFYHDIPDTHTLLPAHPWQVQQWLENPHIKILIREGRLIDLGKTGSDWRATSSVRSVYGRHASFMIKYSLSVRLTNSLRHLLPKEVIRGREIHQVKYHSHTGQALRERFPDFHILTEPAHAAIRGANGKALPETMIVLRENPFTDKASDTTELLATLTQDNPTGHCQLVNVILNLAEKQHQTPNQIACIWFNRYLDRVFKPLILAQADYGLLFGAHQQNLLITLKDGLPDKVYFRDCQGTGYSQTARMLLKEDLPGIDHSAEHHVDDTLGYRLFTYYLLINSTFGVISALGSSGVIPEAPLLQQLRDYLEHLRQGDRQDTGCLDYMLDSPRLWSKGNFFCSFRQINENTLEDPLAIYHTLKNPLHHIERTR